MAYPYEALLPQLTKIAQHWKEKYWESSEGKHKGYKFAVEHADEMAVHLSGTKPEKILKRVRPREDPAISDYRLQSYEPTTKSTAGKALTITGKIFNPALGTVKSGDGEDAEELYKYGTETYPVFNSVVNFLSEYGLKKTMEDPNGVFLIEPGDMPLDYNGNVDLTKRLNPIISCIEAKDIFLRTNEYGLFFVKIEPEKNVHANEKRYYYKYVDKGWLYEFYLYTTDSTNYRFSDPFFAYNHNCGELPFWNCGGTYDLKHMGLFESFFYPAVPHWNKAVAAESDLDGAFIKHLHPQKWEVAEECEYTQNINGVSYSCSRGKMFDAANQKFWDCPGCGGSGRKPVMSPYQTYQIARDKLFDTNGNSLNQPPAGYIDVPTAATQMLVERVQRLKEEGLSALAMDILNEIGLNQSGEAKAYDRTELNDFLDKVASLFYDKHLVNIFYFFAKYMFIGKSEDELASIEPTVIKPIDFDIYSAVELTTQLKTAKDSNINPGYVQAKQIEIQNKEFQQHPDMLPYLNLQVALDPLAEVSRTDVSSMVLDGSVSKITVTIHDNIREFIKRALEEDKDFGAKEYSEQMEVLKGYAEERQTEIDEENKVALEANMDAMVDPAMNNPAPNDPAGTGQ